MSLWGAFTIICWVVGTLLMVGVFAAIAVILAFYRWEKTEDTQQSRDEWADSYPVFHEDVKAP